jgi:mRNA interferase MazF
MQNEYSQNKDFDGWNNLKKILDSNFIKNNTYFNDREVWWTNVGINISKEINGKNNLFERPVLILTKINKHLFLGIPLTTKFKNKKYHSKVKYLNNNKFSFASILQIRVFSSNRLIRKIGMIEKEDYLKTKIKVINLITLK